MEPEIDVVVLAQELVRAVRGRRTQESLSRRLGFGSNVLYMWESGRRAPEFSIFIRMAELCGRKNLLPTFFEDPSSRLLKARLSTPRGVQHLVEELVGEAGRSSLAEKVGVNRTTLARWLQGKSEPRLPDVLRLIRATTQRLIPFVEHFADPAQLDSTREMHADLEAQKRLAYEVPWSHAVLRALELSGYQCLANHSDCFIARNLGLPESEVKQYLKALEDAGQIRWSGTHWVLERVMTVDTRPDPAANLRLKQHWTSVAQDRLSQTILDQDALYSYNLFAISEKNLERIRELHLKYYDQVRALVEETNQADQVVLLNLQLLPLAACGPA